jgi:hypothetical protein
LLAAGLAAQSTSAPPTPVQWRRIVVDPAFRSEGIAIGDVNGDGKRDLLVGDFWYEAPAWQRHAIRPAHDLGDGHDGYSDCFACFADDVDRDGRVDEIVIGFPGQPARWYRNPGKDDGEWTMHLIADSACNESPRFVDLFGDGRRGLLMGSQPAGEMTYLLPGKDPAQAWEKHTIGGPKSPGTDAFSHGLGVGDIDGDGRADVFVDAGYWLQPADARTRTEPWPFTAVALSAPCAQMHVLDLDGDGIGDVISSSAHARGVWWHRQTVGKDGVRAFATADICKEITQTHSLCVADIDGDGSADLITGKRFWAHGPTGDEEPGAAPRLVWIAIERGAAPKFTVHEIDAASGIGTQFEVADVDGDGRPDVAVSNKKGVFLFVQTRASSAAPVKPVRRAAFVRAVDGQGRPLAGADVTCCSLLPVEGWLQASDVVQAKTDVHGRAKVELQPCLEYTAFVVGAVDADDCAVSRTVDGLACGVATEIVAAGKSRPRTLEVGGLDAWGAAAPTRAQLGFSLNAVHLPLSLVDGKVELPPLPTGTSTFLELIDGRGDVFWRRSLSFDAEQQPAAITVPAPQRVPLVVVDDKSAPLTGVSIWQRTVQAGDMWSRRDDEQWHLCGATAADGTLVAECLATGDPFEDSYQGELILVARKDGYGESLAGWQQSRMFQDTKPIERGKSKELHFTLAKRPPLTGKLFDDGVPLVGRRVLLIGMMRLPFDNTNQSWMNLRRTFRAEVAADGSYAFESLPDLQDGTSLVVAADPAAADGKERVSVPLAPLFPVSRTQEIVPTVDLAKTARLSLSMLDLDKAPAFAAKVTLAPVSGNNGVIDGFSTTFRLDPAGRATFRAMPGTWFLLVRDTRSCFTKLIEVGTADQQIGGQLEALATMRLTVLDKDGKPAKGASVQIRGTSWSGGAVEPLQACLRSVSHRLNSELLRAANVGDDGSCVLHFVTPAGVKMRAAMVLAQTYSSQFDLEPDGEQELRIGG